MTVGTTTAASGTPPSALPLSFESAGVGDAANFGNATAMRPSTSV